ncbi:hypothetical protein SVAN01_06514 [Stagonosporopsis vannaccii]|nr:hypothetical protein SVAN01_06514 [Stagonosporopsis vannaccii]
MQILYQPVSKPTLPSTNGAVLEGKGSGSDKSRPSTDRHRQVLSNPKAVIPQTKHARRSLQTISRLQSRAATESWEDDELAAQPLEPKAIAEDSEDELLHDTPKPAAAAATTSPSNPTRASKQIRPTKQAEALKSGSRASSIKTARLTPLEHIDWVFWVQVDDETGYWHSLSDFPRTTQVLFKRVFTTDYLQKPYHVAYYARMLRNRERYLDRDICVGNQTYANRNEASKCQLAKGDKQKTCDTCFKKGRFCARVVEVGKEVKLGFFPVLDASRKGFGWREMGYWVGEKKKKLKRREKAGIEEA